MAHHAWIIEPSSTRCWFANAGYQVDGTSRANEAASAVTCANAKQQQIVSVSPLPTGCYVGALAG